MSDPDDPFRLQRFVDAQDGTFDKALDEIRAGRKQSHWMWFVFPQLAGLGRSSTARHYAIQSLDQAQAYLRHPLLGARLRECTEALLGWAGTRDAADIFGSVDSMKLRSSLTLFEAASPDPFFGRAIDAFFGGERDPATLRLLQP